VPPVHCDLLVLLVLVSVEVREDEWLDMNEEAPLVRWTPGNDSCGYPRQIPS